MILTQKDSIRGNRTAEIKESTVKFTYQDFSKRNSYEIPIKNLRRETSESYNKAFPSLVTGIATLFISAVVLWACCYSWQHHPRNDSSYNLAPAIILGFFFFAWSLYSFRAYVKNSLDLVIFHDQAGQPCLFLYRTNPDEKTVEAFCGELKKRIENPTGRSGVFQ